MANKLEKTELTVEVEFDPATKNVVSERFFLQGQLHRAGDLPAWIKYDAATGKPIEIRFYKHGKLHRPRKPALIEIDPETDVIVKEQFIIHGVTHRDGDYPAIIVRDRRTGTTLAETYMVENMWHRKSGPAKIYYDPETAKVYQQTYFHYGQQRRASKPKNPEIN